MLNTDFSLSVVDYDLPFQVQDLCFLPKLYHRALMTRVTTLLIISIIYIVHMLSDHTPLTKELKTASDKM